MCSLQRENLLPEKSLLFWGAVAIVMLQNAL
jgi:hypothetical protein